ncbi:TPA: type 1 fimbrial protein [Serratia rubidaea]|nr:type 1 fimbrial protein [Serratia rubidaea]HDJ1448123.1 type 1 fimbrial protein [Serratia rubidaea]HDJ1463134.1 type 1 fimbrial protein [Serratia rubidaea]HDJ2774422.1 type 1 fimbrial protein [Serratia rubidaea]
MLLLCASGLAPGAAAAADNWQVEGANGVLHVHGVLTESACRLEMSSAEQSVSLGNTGSGRLQQAGDRGEPVAFQLRLRDCIRTNGSSRDERGGVLSWAANQPLVSVRFIAPADDDNAQLIKVQGVSGLGLRMLDAAGQDIRLGFRGKPQFLTPGQDVLTYRVMPERTVAPLQAGAYRSQINFRLNYD